MESEQRVRLAGKAQEKMLESRNFRRNAQLPTWDLEAESEKAKDLIRARQLLLGTLARQENTMLEGTKGTKAAKKIFKRKQETVEALKPFLLGCGSSGPE